MTLNIDVSPQIEAQIFAAARLNNIAPSEVVAKVLTGEMPPLQSSNKPNGAEQAIEAPTLDPKQAAAIAMLEGFLEESPTDPEEQRQAEADFEEFKNNLNANRITAGERPLFP